MVNKWKLSNNVNCLTYKVPYETDKACLSLVINVGSLYDETHKGISHYLEHMLLMSVENTININENFNIWGYTDFEYTVYQVECLNNINSIKTSLSILFDILTGTRLSLKDMERVRLIILEEYDYFQTKSDMVPLLEMLTYDELLLSSLPIGDLDVIQTLSYEDVLKHHVKGYNKEAVAVSIISAYNNTEVGTLISSVFQKSNKQLHDSFNNMEISNSHLTIRRLFPRDATGFNIYIKNSSSLDNIMKSRALEDFGFIVCENYIEEYFRNCCKIEVDVQMAKIRYTLKCRFFCIKVESVLDEINIWFRNHKDICTILFYEYIIENFSKKEFDIYKAAYANKLIFAKETNISMLNEEVKNHFIFRDPIYEKNDYLEHLKNVEYEEVIILLKKWLVL